MRCRDAIQIVQAACLCQVGCSLPDLPIWTIENLLNAWECQLEHLQRRARRYIRLRAPMRRLTRRMWRDPALDFVNVHPPIHAWFWQLHTFHMKHIWALRDLLHRRIFFPVEYAFLVKLARDARYLE
jgi:hypothetical protein